MHRCSLSEWTVASAVTVRPKSATVRGQAACNQPVACAPAATPDTNLKNNSDHNRTDFRGSGHGGSFVWIFVVLEAQWLR